VLLVFCAVAILYRLAPNVNQPIRWVTPGAVAFVISWLVCTNLFSLYVANSRTYDFIYGTAGGMAILLIWFYMIGLMLLLGLEINQAVDRELGPRRIEQRARELGGVQSEAVLVPPRP
jgi:membrane protein